MEVEATPVWVEVQTLNVAAFAEEAGEQVVCVKTNPIVPEAI